MLLIKKIKEDPRRSIRSDGMWFWNTESGGRNTNPVGEPQEGFSDNGYRRLWIKGKNIRMHRLVYETFIGEIPDGMQVDHINGIRRDNRLENLRLATHQANQRASRRKTKNATSRFRGVSWDKQSKKWLASITNFGRTLYYERFDDEAEAALARDKKAIELGYPREGAELRMKIKEEDQEVLLQVLLMLTDKTYYPESMAPMIGGGAHGELYPLGEPMVPCLTLWRTDKGKVLGRAFDNYVHQRIDITETESICIFKHKSMYPNETVLVLAAWAHDFYEQKYKNYEAKNETESIPN